MPIRKQSDAPSVVEDAEGQALTAAAAEQLAIDRQVLADLLPTELQHHASHDR
jgi:hypothetical protein